MLEEHLRTAPEDLKNQAAPEPDWSECSRSLTSALEGWHRNSSGEPDVRVFLKAPYSGIDQAMALWAKAGNYHIMAPPSADQLVHGKDIDISGIIEPHGTPLVIPSLERFFLRHFNGLMIIQQLMEAILSSPCRCVIGCDSWAWEFLKKTVRIDALLPEPMVFEALDSEKLKRWFCTLACRSAPHPLIFRQSNSGKYVLPVELAPPETETNAPADERVSREQIKSGELSDFLVHLAAYCRGIDGIAWDIWRYSLRYGPDEEHAEVAPENVHEHTIWVEPWSQLPLPSVPDSVTYRERLLLHALLIHRGLAPDLMGDLLPLSQGEVMQAIFYLKSKGLICLNEGRWYVTSLGYPAVRRFLSREGYLIDAL